MRIVALIWLEEIVEKLAWKPSVEQAEVEEVFVDGPAFRFVERGYRPGEDGYGMYDPARKETL